MIAILIDFPIVINCDSRAEKPVTRKKHIVYRDAIGGILVKIVVKQFVGLIVMLFGIHSFLAVSSTPR
jgi:hypothetical protein